MPRKTVDVKPILERVNHMLKTPDSTLRLTGKDGADLTPEQAFRLGIASLLETILHESGNYAGYNYQPGLGITFENGAENPTFVDDSRRFYYYASTLASQDVSA